jgi:hypothetical protein
MSIMAKEEEKKHQGICSQCRLAGTVRAHDGNTRVESDIEIDVLQDRWLVCRISKGHLRELQKRRRNLFRIREAERLGVFKLRRGKLRKLKRPPV